MRLIKNIQESTNTVPSLPGQYKGKHPRPQKVQTSVPGRRRHWSTSASQRVVTCYLGRRKHSGMSKNGSFLDILNVKNTKVLLLRHLSVFATAVFAKNLWGSWLGITVLISSFESCLVKQEEIWVAWFVFYCYPKKIAEIPSNMELWSANIWLKQFNDPMNTQSLSCNFLIKNINYQERNLLAREGKSSIPLNNSPRINALAKTAPLPPSKTCRHLLCYKDLACDCDTKTQTSASFLTSVAWKSFRHSHYLSHQQHDNFFYSQFSLMIFTAAESAKDLARLTPISLCTFWKSCA